MMPVAAARLASTDHRDGLPRPVDLVHLARQTMGDRSLELEILNLYRVQSSLLMARIRGASGNLDAIRMNAHTIKGSASGIGAFEVSELAEALFHAPCDGCVRTRLETAMARANAYIESLLD